MQTTILLLSNKLGRTEQQVLIGQTIQSALEKWTGPALEPALTRGVEDFMQFVGLFEGNPSEDLADAFFHNRNELASCVALFLAMVQHCNKNNHQSILENFTSASW